MKINISSKNQLDSLILANLCGRYLALVTTKTKEFEEDFINYYESPRELIEYITNKEPVLKEQLKEIEGIERQNYFWTIKAQSLEITKKIQNELLKSLEKGESFHTFRTNLEDNDLFRYEDLGYWDSAYNMNIALAQSRGNWQAMQANKENDMHYAKYSAILDGRETKKCNSLHNKVMSIDEFEKLGLVPPIHFGCRSTLIQLLDNEVMDEQGKYRRHIKTLNNEQKRAISRQVQKGFGKIDKKSLKKYVEEKQKKVYNVNEKLKGIENKKRDLSTFGDFNSDDFKKLKIDLNDNEYNIVYNSTGYIRTHNSFEINKLLRDDNYNALSLANKKVVDTLDKIIKKTKLDKDTKLYRFVKENFLDFLDDKIIDNIEHNNLNIDKILWENKIDDINLLANKLKSLVGIPFEDKGFFSTSFDKQKNYFRDYSIMLEVYTPKNSSIFVTENLDESEIILNRNSKFKIIDTIIEKIKLYKIEELDSRLEEDTYVNKIILKILKLD